MRTAFLPLLFTLLVGICSATMYGRSWANPVAGTTITARTLEGVWQLKMDVADEVQARLVVIYLNSGSYSDEQLKKQLTAIGKGSLFSSEFRQNAQQLKSSPKWKESAEFMQASLDFTMTFANGIQTTKAQGKQVGHQSRYRVIAIAGGKVTTELIPIVKPDGYFLPTKEVYNFVNEQELWMTQTNGRKRKFLKVQ